MFSRNSLFKQETTLIVHVHLNVLYELKVESFLVVLRRSPKSEAGARIAVYYYAVNELEPTTCLRPGPSLITQGQGIGEDAAAWCSTTQILLCERR